MALSKLKKSSVVSLHPSRTSHSVLLSNEGKVKSSTVRAGVQGPNVLIRHFPLF